MTLQVPHNKLYQETQELNFSDTNIFTLIGENGSGKSSILESIFQKYIEDEDKKVICFTSGQNELFYSIFNEHKRQSNKFKPDENNIINSFYFDYWWVRFLVFFAITLKRDGKVKQYFDEKNYDLSSLSIYFKFRVRQPYINQIKSELKREAEGEFALESKRRTIHYNLLLRFINKKINAEYDFDEFADSIVKRGMNLNVAEAREIFGIETNKIFTFLSHATMGWLSNIDIKSCGLYLHQNSQKLEFEQLSDGEYQLLAIYALIDLFDGENTIFLFDEIDSHLHYSNIKKLWALLKTTSGKIITTTHITESIVLNDIKSIKVVEKGKLDEDVIINKILLRLENLTSNHNYHYKLASKLKHIALVENYTDWFIFRELCKIKIADFSDEIFNKVQYINCSAGYETRTEDFGNGKLKWYANYKENIHIDDNNIKNLFMICDRDNMPIGDIKTIDERRGYKIGDHVLVNNSNLEHYRNLKPYLLSWRRKQIENYLLSKTMLEEKGILQSINDELPVRGHLQENNAMDIESIQNVEIKNKIKVLYSNIGDTYGICYDTLKETISLIPSDEISEDIVSMYEFIKNKVEN